MTTVVVSPVRTFPGRPRDDPTRPGGRRVSSQPRFATYKEASAWLAETRSHVGAGSFVRPRKVTSEQWVTAWPPILDAGTPADVRQLRAQPPAAPAADPRLATAPEHQARRPLHPLRLAAHQRQGRPRRRHRPVAPLRRLPRDHRRQVPRGRIARRPAADQSGSTGRGPEGVLDRSPARAVPHLVAAGPRPLPGSDSGAPAPFGWLLLATTGLRRGEAPGVAWSSIAPDDGRLSVTRTLVDLVGDLPVWSDPKTARGRRSIAFDPGTVAALRAQRIAQAQGRLMSGAEYVDHDLVFARPDGRGTNSRRAPGA